MSSIKHEDVSAAKVGAISADIGLMSAECEPISAEFGAHSGRIRPTRADFVRNRPNSHQPRSMSPRFRKTQVRAASIEGGPSSTEIGPESAKLWAASGELGRFRPKAAMIWPHSQIGRARAAVGRHRPNSVEFAPSLTGSGPDLAGRCWVRAGGRLSLGGGGSSMTSRAGGRDKGPEVRRGPQSLAEPGIASPLFDAVAPKCVCVCEVRSVSGSRSSPNFDPCEAESKQRRSAPRLWDLIGLSSSARLLCPRDNGGSRPVPEREKGKMCCCFCRRAGGARLKLRCGCLYDRGPICTRAAESSRERSLCVPAKAYAAHTGRSPTRRLGAAHHNDMTLALLGHELAPLLQGAAGTRGPSLARSSLDNAPSPCCCVDDVRGGVHLLQRS